jgi:hypothetical protein
MLNPRIARRFESSAEDPQDWYVECLAKRMRARVGGGGQWIALPMARRPQARQEKEIDTCYESA